MSVSLKDDSRRINLLTQYDQAPFGESVQAVPSWLCIDFVLDIERNHQKDAADVGAKDKLPSLFRFALARRGKHDVADHPRSCQRQERDHSDIVQVMVIRAGDVHPDLEAFESKTHG
jgi:hypothetical protein